MGETNFFIRRIHSIMGLMPIGFFLLEHIFSISQAIRGPEAFDHTVALIQAIPYVIILEVGMIAVPILFHGVYGLYIAYVARNNVLRYNYLRNWMFYLQRITAVITLFFVLWHVWVLRIGKELYGFEINFSFMANLLADPITAGLYTLGLVAAVFHFANGLWTFLITWGITVGPRAQRMAMVVCSTLFCILSGVGITAIAYFI